MRNIWTRPNQVSGILYWISEIMHISPPHSIHIYPLYNIVMRTMRENPKTKGKGGRQGQTGRPIEIEETEKWDIKIKRYFVAISFPGKTDPPTVPRLYSLYCQQEDSLCPIYLQRPIYSAGDSNTTTSSVAWIDSEGTHTNLTITWTGLQILSTHLQCNILIWRGWLLTGAG